MKDQVKYLLDTNVFNDVLDGKIEHAVLRGKRLVVTHVQRDEINRTPEEARRKDLLSIFGLASREPTESLVWGVSAWGEAKWGVDDGRFNGMRQELDKRNKNKKNNPQDILIAETALRNGWVLVTADVDLFGVVTKWGGACANAFVLGLL
jgi:predicted nucleic acid-binding protein